jgi:integrase
MGQYLKTRYPGIFQYVGKNGTAYGISYRAGGIKHREIIGPLLGEAQEKLAEKKAMVKKGTVLSVSEKRKITFEKLKEKYCELQKGERSFETSKKHFVNAVSEFFKDKRLFQITPFDIEQFKKQRKETPVRGGKIRSDVSVNRELEVLRHMLNKAVEWGMLDENPFTRFKDPIFFEERNDRVRFLEEEEIKTLLDVSPLYLANLIKGAIFTGLRKGDLFNLKWSDVNLERGFLNYREQKKMDKLGFKYLNGDMISLLMEIPKGQDDYIFLGPDGKPLKDIKRSFHTALKRAGIKDFHWHDLRHTSASHLLMRGASMKAVKEHLGHTTIAMTERYSHLSKDFQREEVNRLNGLCGESGKKLVRNEDLVRNEVEVKTIATA